MPSAITSCPTENLITWIEAVTLDYSKLPRRTSPPTLAGVEIEMLNFGRNFVIFGQQPDDVLQGMRIQRSKGHLSVTQSHLSNHPGRPSLAPESRCQSTAGISHFLVNNHMASYRKSEGSNRRSASPILRSTCQITLAGVSLVLNRSLSTHDGSHAIDYFLTTSCCAWNLDVLFDRSAAKYP